MSTGRLILVLTAVAAIGTAAPAFAAPGDLDPAFGTSGKYLAPLDHSTSVNNVVARSDGGTLVGGASWVEGDGGLGYRATVFGFTVTGQPDPAFGQNGRVVLPSTLGAAWVALQGERIVVAARDSDYRLVVYRLNADGALDTGFATEGVANTALSAGGGVPRVAVGQDQRIDVVSTSAPIPGLIVARLLPDGEGFDSSFGGGVVYGESGPQISAQAIAAGPGEAVTVLAGPRRGGSGPARLFRFAADGTPDAAFGSGGQAPIALDGYMAGMALRADGSSVVGGYLPGTSQGVVAALTPAGDLDRAFASDGAAELERRSGVVNAVGIDSAGRILATGTSQRGLFLARYLSNGTLDSTFGRNGIARGKFDRVTTGEALAFAPDGRIVVAAQRVTGFRSDFLVLGLMRFLVGQGPRDLDADGFVGKRDRCPDVPAASHRGCPLLKRAIEAAYYSNARFKGLIGSRKGACRGIGKVKVFKVRRSQDALLGTVPVRASGTFVLRLSARFRGRIYARAPRVFVPDAGLCAAVRSANVLVP